jgi:serine/threonine-protein kinase
VNAGQNALGEKRYWTRLVLASGLGGFVLFYLVFNLTVKGGKVQMPDLKGLPKGAAEAKLSGLGLKVSVREERFSSGAGYGAVLEQDIEPGATIKRGRSVELILSKGTKLVNVPQLTGLTSARQAKLLLEQNGLSEGIEADVEDESPKDTVLAQAPEAGVEVARGAAVSLLISLGPRKQAWVMPDLEGLDLGAVRTKVRKMGLVLRHVTEKEVPGVSPGSVASQSLEAGSRVEEGAELNLVAAAGSASLEGARLAEISYDLGEEGVTERRVMITVTDSLGERTVLNRMASPGETLKAEARVHGKASYRVNVAGTDVEEKEIP